MVWMIRGMLIWAARRWLAGRARRYVLHGGRRAAWPLAKRWGRVVIAASLRTGARGLAWSYRRWGRF
ncbi:MAG: hypothetical protein GEU80_09925 [Dehalococcoidia bacterium]|nr:hypothetical protein [Dehalococcoidia bacterium]